MQSDVNNVNIWQCEKCDFLLEEGRFHNVFEDKPAKWPIAKKKTKSSKYTPTTNSYDFARRSGH